MNSIALYFASGESLYTGAALLVATIVFSPLLRHPLLLRLRSLAAWVALAMIVMACPPFPWTVYFVFLGTFALWFVTTDRDTPKQSKTWIRAVATVSLLALLVVLPASEFLHRRKPAIIGLPGDHLVVIGDSISAGIDPRTPAWPSIFQQETGVSVKNLAQPGAQVRDGITMAEQVTPSDRMVLIEIGGNDLLGGTSSEEFGRGLDAILSKLAEPGRIVVMFELPLLPNKIAYGQIQRRLAAKYGVWLIPKRYLVDVIGGKDATTDGLHLATAGTQYMATLVAAMLNSVLKASAPHT